ncbi:MAG TPA: hypothetical protein PLB12_05205, partial [Candidatus Goldiibacteriota bacterium]|nr:hypothetical protein [Candidatus Goldiibacteriota bacterium]
MKTIVITIFMFIGIIGAADAAGEGAATISPLTVAANTSGNEMTIVFNANGTVWTNGQLRVTIPVAAGWSEPSGISNQDGYYTVSVSGGVIETHSASSPDIIITVSSLNADGEITIVYGASTQGATSQSGTGNAYFNVYTDPVGIAVAAITPQPYVVVSNSTETATETITETATQTATETITETQTQTVTETATETVTQTATETITETET